MTDDPASRDAFRWEIRQSLVERLRIPWEGMGEMANQQRAAAAIQISTMMDELEAWRQAMQKAERDIKELRGMLEVAKEMAEHYVNERDEARREVCSMNETGLRMNESDKKREAKRRGWDCFKEKP